MWEIFSVHAVFTLSFASHPKPEWLWNQNTIFFPDISVVRIISFSDWRAFLSTLYTWHAYCICKNKSGTDEEQKINVSLTMYLPRHMIWLTHEKLCHEGISCYEPVMGHNVCMTLQKLKYNVLSYRNGRHTGNSVIYWRRRYNTHQAQNNTIAIRVKFNPTLYSTETLNTVFCNLLLHFQWGTTFAC